MAITRSPCWRPSGMPSGPRRADGMKVRLAVAPSILTQVYARDGLGLFDRSNANIAVELVDRRNGRCFERQPALFEFSPGAEDAEGFASRFRPGSAFELEPCS